MGGRRKKNKKSLQLAINANPAKLIRKMEVETDLNMNGDLSNTQHGGIKSRNFVKKKRANWLVGKDCKDAR